MNLDDSTSQGFSKEWTHHGIKPVKRGGMILKSFPRETLGNGVRAHKAKFLRMNLIKEFENGVQVM